MRHSEPGLADPWLDHLVVDFDEDQQWILIRRGDLVIACNLGTQPVTVPVTGEVLAWGTPEVNSETTVLDGHTFAILRTAPAAEPALPSTRAHSRSGRGAQVSYH